MVLLNSTKIAVAAYIVGIGFLTLLIEPFVGLINYVVFLYLRPQEYIEGFVGMPVMLMIGGATLVMMVINSAITRRSPVAAKVPQNLLMILMLAAILLSHLSHAYLHGAMASGRAFLSTLVMYFLIANLACSERKIKITLYSAGLLTLILAFQGIKQYITGVGIAGQTMVEGRIRGIGIFSDPNDLGLTFLVILPFMVLTLIEAKAVILKILMAAAACTVVFALYLTNSRGGFLSLGVLAFLLVTRRFGLLTGLGAGSMLFAAAFILGPSRMSEISPQEASAYGRIEAWGIGFDMLKQNPLFGVGAGRFLDFHFRTAHNSIVLCLSELGIFGLYIWGTMIMLSIKNMFIIASEAREQGMKGIACAADSVMFGLIGFITAAFFLSRTYNELLYLLIGMSAAVSSVFIKKSETQYALMEKRDFLQGFILIAGILLLLKIILTLFW